MKHIILAFIGLNLLAGSAFAERTRLPDFQSYCDRVATTFNGPAQKRSIPFSFVNYRGVSQNSEAAVYLEKTCVPAVANSSFVLVRTSNMDNTPAANLTTIINIDKLGNNEFEVQASSTECSDRFFNFVKPKMEASGTVFNDAFTVAFSANLRDEYCPKYSAAVKQALLDAIQNTK